MIGMRRLQAEAAKKDKLAATAVSVIKQLKAQLSENSDAAAVAVAVAQAGDAASSGTMPLRTDSAQLAVCAWRRSLLSHHS